VPLFNSDIEKPGSVTELDAELRSAAGVIVVTPEYNYGIPGPLKNILDWLSRPAYQSGFAQKPVTLLGAAPGVIGTARAQGQLKQVLLGMAAHVYPSPELTVGEAASKFDASGTLIDKKTGAALDRLVAGFIPFVEKNS
jgi:chromate reductase